MHKTNCPNCAAPIDPTQNKCQYCGTSYFDLSSIDFDDHKPIWLKIKTPMGIITSKVIPSLDSIDFHSEYTDARDTYGNTICRFATRNIMIPHISFMGVPFDYNNQEVLITLETDKEL